MEYLRTEGLIATEDMVMTAINVNSVVVLKWIFTHFGSSSLFTIALTSDYVAYAVGNGNDDVLEYLVETVGKRTNETMVRMVGHICDPTEVATIKGFSWLKYLLDQNFICSPNVQRIAMFYHDLEMLRYIKYKNIPLDIELLKKNEPYITAVPENINRTGREGTIYEMTEIYEWLNMIDASTSICFIK